MGPGVGPNVDPGLLAAESMIASRFGLISVNSLKHMYYHKFYHKLSIEIM